MAKKKAAENVVAVIMAGGSGERFWPLSRVSRPKQLLRLTHPTETLLEEVVNRTEPLIPTERIYVATSRVLAQPIKRAKLGIPPRNVLAEPCKRNTAGCLCWVAAELLARYNDPEMTMAVLTADHKIGQPAKFLKCVETAVQAARDEDALVTLGIKPDRPETGYGYIEVARPPKGATAVAVSRFREKPNLKTAQRFLESGRHYWNSGMFIWKLSTFLSEMEKASPVHGEITREMAEAMRKRKRPVAEAAFEKLPNISIDFALMEKSRNVLMVPATFPWDDVGSWDALDRSRKADRQGNVTDGNPVLVDVKKSIVINDAGEENVAVGVLGLENIVVIVSGDSVLVAPKNRVQDVRQIVGELKKRGSDKV